MAHKSHLLKAIEAVHQEVLHFAAQISPEERLRRGTEQAWAPKDLLAHLAEWQCRSVETLQAARRGDTPQDWEDLDLANKEIFHAYSHTPWDSILEVWEKSHQALVAEVQAYDEAQLNDDQRFSWNEGRPLWRYISGSCFTHLLFHLQGYYLQQGEHERAIHLTETLTQRMQALDDSPAWQGILQYNLACAYALAGDNDTALAKLKLGLNRNPDLLDWSLQDADLNRLRADERFQPIVQQIRQQTRHINAVLDQARLIKTLEKVLDLVERTGAVPEYRLVGTGAALLHGVELPAGDVDLLVRDRYAVEVFAQALREFPCRIPPTWLCGENQYFAEYEVEDVAVGVSAVEVPTEEDGIETYGPAPWQYYDLLTCGRHQVPTVKLELRLATELARQRQDRSEPLIQFLRQRGFDRHLFFVAMNAAGFNPHQQEQIISRLE